MRPYPKDPPPATVHVTPVGERLEVRLARGYSWSDVEVLRSIQGRRWDPHRMIWTVPDCAASRQRLGAAFGGRLREEGPSAAGTPSPAAAGAPPPALFGLPRGESAAEPAADPVADPVAEDVADLAADPVAEDVADRIADHVAEAAAEQRPTSTSDALQADVRALTERIRDTMRTREYSPKTERAYLGWVKRFYRFVQTGPSPPAAAVIDATHAVSFLEHLAKEERLAPKSRNQAASALSFLFREILGRDELTDVPRAKGSRRVPTVLSHREVMRVLEMLSGKYRLIVVLLYSAGLRIEECLSMRVKDVDFELRQILVRDGKGRKDRFVPLAERACEPLRRQIQKVRTLHARSRQEGGGWAPLPGALHRKDPSAGYELAWQFVFPARKPKSDRATGRPCRVPLHATAVQRAVKAAVKRSGVQKRATCHTFRHSFATELLRSGCDVRTLQQVMGHRDIRTTMIYLHAVEQTGLGIRSPLDRTFDEAESPTTPRSQAPNASPEPQDSPGLPWD